MRPHLGVVYQKFVLSGLRGQGLVLLINLRIQLQQ
jgi:hypothetical protein